MNIFFINFVNYCNKQFIIKYPFKTDYFCEPKLTEVNSSSKSIKHGYSIVVKSIHLEIYKKQPIIFLT